VVESQQLTAVIASASKLLALDRALAEVTTAFRQRGVESLLLKGPAFAQWLYATPRERSYDDIDLLVEPDHFAAAESALAELGFVDQEIRAGPHARTHHAIWQRPNGRQVTVELHHCLAGMAAAPRLVWERMSAEAESITVGDCTVLAPSVCVSALTVALHAAQHGVVGRKHLVDLDRALERVELAEWRTAAWLAEELGAAEAFALGLRLREGGHALADQLELTTTASREVRLRASGPPDTAFGIERLAAARGVGGRLRLVAQELSPSPAFMRLRYPLARRGRRGLIVSYLLRPGWIAVKLPRGAQAWLRAQSATASPRPGRWRE
jgi:hypothetical protein